MCLCQIKVTQAISVRILSRALISISIFKLLSHFTSDESMAVQAAGVPCPHPCCVLHEYFNLLETLDSKVYQVGFGSGQPPLTNWLILHPYPHFLTYKKRRKALTFGRDLR